MNIVLRNEKKIPSTRSSSTRINNFSSFFPFIDGHISVVHENSGAYPCLNCGKKFAVKSTLDQHIISVHNKEERYRCDLCERGFSRKDYYQIHVRTVHEGSKPYSCDHCGSSYGQMGDMYRHVRKVHGIEPVKVRS